MLQKRLGIHIFTRGMKGGVNRLTRLRDVYYELLKTMQVFKYETFQNISIPKLPVFTTEEGIKQIKNNLDKIDDWKNVIELIPNFYKKNKMEKTGIAGIFAASLELTKEGLTVMSQNKIFDKLMIKKS